MKEQRQPKPGDSVVIVRSDELPSIVGECGEITEIPDSGNFYKVDVDGQAVILARGDFILRAK